MSRETIAKALKRLREQSGLTADDVGELVGKSGKTVNAWENNRGQPDVDTFFQLCDIYNVGDILAEFKENSPQNVFSLSNHEKKLVTAYRNKPELQYSIDKLLDVISVNDNKEITDTMFDAFESVKNIPTQKITNSK